MKNKILIALFLAAFIVLGSCKESFFEIKPKGSLGVDVLATEKGVSTLLIGAYSMLDGVTGSFGWESTSSNWVYGDIRGMIGNKGTDAGDQPDINPLQGFYETSTNSYLNVKWREVYEAISRCNATINVTAKALEAGSITQDQADLFVKQARGLRAWYHFEAWRMWEKIPFMAEDSDPSEASNSADVSDLILADFEYASTLPNNMGDVGRFNGTVVKVLWAKALMQMKHDYATAKTLLGQAKAGTKPNGAAIGLASTYGEIFDIENRNGIESVFTVQYSVNDGSGGRNGGYGEVLNFPYKGNGGSPAGCCGFYQATQEYVNSFRTTAAGLPMLDFSYNNDPVKNDQGVALDAAYTPDQGNLDPRLDWSVGRRGIPYWDWGLHTGSDWIRDQSYAGPYSPKKQVYAKSQEGVWTEVGNWTSGYTANGYRMIRYADVLLLEAECMIETGDVNGALTNINLVRARAMNPAGFVKFDDGTPAGHYVIGTYTSFPDADYARTALRMERKLELGMEGHRYFDLQRWGIVQTELSRVLAYEKTMPWGASMYGTATVGAEDKNFPIPQRQIDLSKGNLVQNR